MSGEALGRDQSCTTRGHTFDKNDIEDGLWQMFLDDDWNTDDWEHYVNDNAIGYLEDIIFATESEN